MYVCMCACVCVFLNVVILARKTILNQFFNIFFYFIRPTDYVFGSGVHPGHAKPSKAKLTY